MQDKKFLVHYLLRLNVKIQGLRDELIDTEKEMERVIAQLQGEDEVQVEDEARRFLSYERSEPC